MGTEAQISMSQSQFEAMMVRLATELRKPPVDPIKEAQAVRQRKLRDEGNAERWKREHEKHIRCQHSRPDGSCVIAWARQSDDQWRGYCPHCDTSTSMDDELRFALYGFVAANNRQPDEKEMQDVKKQARENYVKLFNRPRGMMESVRVVA